MANSEVLIQNLCDGQIIPVYGTNNSEIDSVIINSVFLLKSEQKTHVKIADTLSMNGLECTEFMQLVFMINIGIGQSHRKGFCFQLEKGLPVHTA